MALNCINTAALPLTVSDYSVLVRLLVVLLVLAWSLWKFRRIKKGIQNSCAVYAEVVGYKVYEYASRRRRIIGSYHVLVEKYMPILRYTTEDGAELQQTYRYPMTYKPFQEGEEVLIHYFREKPEFFYFPGKEAEICRIYPIITLFSGLAVLTTIFELLHRLFF